MKPSSHGPVLLPPGTDARGSSSHDPRALQPRHGLRPSRGGLFFAGPSSTPQPRAFFQPLCLRRIVTVEVKPGGPLFRYLTWAVWIGFVGSALAAWSLWAAGPYAGDAKAAGIFLAGGLLLTAIPALILRAVRARMWLRVDDADFLWSDIWGRVHRIPFTDIRFLFVQVTPTSLKRIALPTALAMGGALRAAVRPGLPPLADRDMESIRIHAAGRRPLKVHVGLFAAADGALIVEELARKGVDASIGLWSDYRRLRKDLAA